MEAGSHFRYDSNKKERKGRSDHEKMEEEQGIQEKEDSGLQKKRWKQTSTHAEPWDTATWVVKLQLRETQEIHWKEL